MNTTLHEIRALLEEGLPLFRQYAGEPATDTVARHFADKLACAEPTVMVFGIYNAGKSTLLNALLGEERAAVSDCPQTSVVTPYPWNGLTLLDTPGIDAPEEHERISRQQLAQSEVVLFVMSTDGTFDEQSLYEDILAIHAQGRRVMVIVNDKNGYQEGTLEYRAIYDQILSHLESVGSAEVMQQIPVRWVNARQALKGKLEGKSRLVATSGIAGLERELARFIRQTDSQDIARVLGQRLVRLIDASLNALEVRTTGEDIRLVGEIQAAVDGEKARAHQSVLAAMRRIIYGFRSRLRVAVENANETGIQAAINEALEMTSVALEREMNEVAASLGRWGQTLAARESLRITCPQPGVMDGDNGAGRQAGADATGFVSAASMVSSAAARLSAEAVEEATRAAVLVTLKYVKDTLPSLMRGIGKVGMERIAGRVGSALSKATPFIGPVIDTALSIRNYYQACEEEARHEAEQRKRLQAIHDCVERTAEHLEAELADACRGIINQAFQPMEHHLAANLATLSGENRRHVTDRHALASLRGRLQDCLDELTAGPCFDTLNTNGF